MTVSPIPSIADPSAALAELGLELPALEDDAKYINSRASQNGLIFISGQLPYRDGVLPITGAVTDREDAPVGLVDLDTAREMMQQATLNALSAAADAVGGIARVRVVQLLVFVLSEPGFGQQSKVADAGSEMLVHVLGEEGRHARTAIGVAGLPRNSPVEVQMICEVRA